MSNKVIKSVSFNVTNEDDTKMLKHFSRRNFSGYVKKLIMEDMKLREQEKTQQEPTERVKTQVLTPAEKLALLKAQNGINSQSDSITNNNGSNEEH